MVDQIILETTFLIDLEPDRACYPLTWRRLSIGEELQNIDRSIADGFRARAGNSQWMFYRSLDETACRTLLGQHLSCEFFVGSVEEDGNATELLSIG